MIDEMHRTWYSSSQKLSLIRENERILMSAKDTHHDAVVEALEKDGWKITHDPLRILWEQKVMFVDLGAEPIIAAEKEHEKIAVEILQWREA